MGYLILSIIIAVLILVLVLLVKQYNKTKNDLVEKKIIINELKADRNRLQTSLEDIETIRRKAKNERKKINAADNSDVANILNDMLSKPANTGSGS